MYTMLTNIGNAILYIYGIQKFECSACSYTAMKIQAPHLSCIQLQSILLWRTKASYLLHWSIELAKWIYHMQVCAVLLASAILSSFWSPHTLHAINFKKFFWLSSCGSWSQQLPSFMSWEIRKYPAVLIDLWTDSSYKSTLHGDLQ